jgi:hypothetical protein
MRISFKKLNIVKTLYPANDLAVAEPAGPPPTTTTVSWSAERTLYHMRGGVCWAASPHHLGLQAHDVIVTLLFSIDTSKALCLVLKWNRAVMPEDYWMNEDFFSLLVFCCVFVTVHRGRVPV